MTFFGRPARPRSPRTSRRRAMRWPLVVLAVPTVLLGARRCCAARAGCRPGWAAVDDRELHRVGGAPSVVARTVLRRRVGAVRCTPLWRRRTGGRPGSRGSAGCGRALEHAFYVDDLYDRAFVRPVAAPRARGRRRTDDTVVDGAVRGSGRGAAAAGRGCCGCTQDGNVQRYLTGLLAGVLLIVASGW